MTAEYPNLELLDYIFRRAIEDFVKPDQSIVVDFDVHVFPQIWPNTGGGFATPGYCYGQSFIKQYTTVFISTTQNVAMVFFGNRPAYIIQNPNQKFVDDFNRKQMKSKYEALKHYKEEQDGKENTV